jgi:spore maturation protein CgeB
MKILLVAKPWRGGLGRYFYLAMKEMFPGGVRWLSTRPLTFADELTYRRDQNIWWERFRRNVDSADCDAVLFIGSRPEFRGIKAHPRYVLYLTDDVKMQACDLEVFGRIFLSDRGYEPELAALSKPWQYGGVLPLACYPPLHYPVANAERRKGVYFVGNRDPKRDPYVARLLDSELPARVVGNYFAKHPLFWRRPLAFRPTIDNAKLSRAYGRCEVSLNVHARVVRMGTNQRSFEAAACGVPQVVERRPGIEEYFEPGEEMLLCHDPDEMVAQLRAALSDRAASAKMAERARRRVLAEHTFYHRIATAFAHLAPRGQLDAALRAVTAARH